MTHKSNNFVRVLAGSAAFVLVNLLIAYLQTGIPAYRDQFWNNFSLDVAVTTALIAVVVLMIKALMGQWPWESDF